MHTYPTAAELTAMGENLQRDVCLWTARLSREYCNTYSAPVYTRAEPEPKPEKAPKARNHAAVPDAPRVYASQYVGVSTRRGQAYLANWSIAGKGKTGPLRPATPQGERWAAQDRARAMGLDYLEMRDGTKIAYKQAEPEEMAA